MDWWWSSAVQTVFFLIFHLGLSVFLTDLLRFLSDSCCCCHPPHWVQQAWHKALRVLSVTSSLELGRGFEGSCRILKDLSRILKHLAGSSWVLQDLEWPFRTLNVFVESSMIVKFLTGAWILKSVSEWVSDWVSDRARSREASASKKPF